MSASPADVDDAIAAMPRAQPPASFGEVWDANWQAAGLDTMFGQYGPRQRASDDLTQAWQRVTGATPEQTAQGAGRSLATSDYDERAAVLNSLAGGLPDEQQKALAPYLDVDAGAAKYANEIEQRQASVNQRAYGLMPNSAAWIADLSRQLVDPSNLAASVVGGPEIGGLGGMFAREFAVNAGFGVLQHVETADEKQRLGLPETSLLGDAVSAGLFGTAIGLGLRGAGFALRRAFGDTTAPRVEGFAEKPLPADSPAVNLDPADFEAAAAHQARNVAIDALSPDPSFEGRAQAREAVDTAAAAFETEDAPLGFSGAPPRGPISETPTVEPVQHPGLDQAIDAFHGTPHEFVQFSSDKIGSGDGNQAFGQGIYLAERRGVGEWYRDKLAPDGGGNLYQVKVTSPRDSFIEWDKPLEQQPAPVRSAIEAAGYAESDLNRLKNDLQSSVSGKALAADLNSRGVSGVRYLDAVSRRAGRGTSNLVVFNDKDILISHRNDEPILDVALRERGIDPAEVPQAVRDKTLDIMVRDKITHPIDAVQRALKEFRDEANAREAKGSQAGRYDGLGALDGSGQAGKVKPAGLEAGGEASPEAGGAGRNEQRQADVIDAEGSAPSPASGEAGAGASPAPADAPSAQPKPQAEPSLAAQRADVERGLAAAEAAGDDVRVMSADGLETSARAQLSAVDQFKAAARELGACIVSFAA